MKNFSRYIALFFSVLIIGLIFYFFNDIVAFVLIAWVLSLIGQPLMNLFQRRIRFGQFRAGPAFSAILTILVFFIFFTLLIWTFVPIVIEQAGKLAGVDYAAITNALQEPLTEMNNKLASWGIVEGSVNAETQIQTALQSWFKPAQIGNFFSSIIIIAGNLLFAVFSIVFITFFFLKEQGLFINFLVAVTPEKYEQEIRNGLVTITSLLTRYFGGILLQISIITLLVSTALMALGVDNALLIGFFAAIINVIPYIGPFIGAAFGIFITISANVGLEFYEQLLPLLIKVAGVFAIMQLIDNLILQPYIFSRSVLAHPLEIFIVVLIGAKLNGVIGMILAIPSYTILRVIAGVFLSEFKIVQKLTLKMASVPPPKIGRREKKPEQIQKSPTTPPGQNK